MLDIKATREEIKSLYEAATTHEDKYSAEDASDEAKAEQEARFSKLEKLTASLEAQTKLARFAFSKEPAPADVKVSSVRVELPKKSRDQIAVEQFSDVGPATAEDYSRAISEWVRTGQVSEEYDTIISTTGNSVMLPKIVSTPIYPIKTNVFRRALASYGISPESYGSTAQVASPVITPGAGGVIVEGQQNTCGNDNNPSIGGIDLSVKGYHSGAIWFSNLLIGALNWKVTSVLPALQASEDYAFSKAIVTAMLADTTNITQIVPTATISTLVLDNLDDLNQLLPIPWDQRKVIILSPAAYNAAEKLKDSTGLPILSRNDIQNDAFLSFKGTPVFKSDALAAFGANHVVGMVFSVDGFKLRDELDKLVQYVDNPCYVDQTGLDYVRYQGYGYVPAAVGFLKNPAS